MSQEQKDNLKTLKDFDYEYRIFGVNKGDIPIPEEIEEQIHLVVRNALIFQKVWIRKEAIKWIEKIDHEWDNAIFRFAPEDKIKELEKNKENMRLNTLYDFAVVEFIKHFFNIDESDLDG